MLYYCIIFRDALGVAFLIGVFFNVCLFIDVFGDFFIILMTRLRIWCVVTTLAPRVNT